MKRYVSMLYRFKHQNDVQRPFDSLASLIWEYYTISKSPCQPEKKMDFSHTLCPTQPKRKRVSRAVLRPSHAAPSASAPSTAQGRPRATAPSAAPAHRWPPTASLGGRALVARPGEGKRGFWARGFCLKKRFGVKTIFVYLVFTGMFY